MWNTRYVSLLRVDATFQNLNKIQNSHSANNNNEDGNANILSQEENELLDRAWENIYYCENMCNSWLPWKECPRGCTMMPQAISFVVFRFVECLSDRLVCVILWQKQLLRKDIAVDNAFVFVFFVCCLQVL